SGTLERRVLADGSSLDRQMLGILPAGNLGSIGKDVLVPVAPGTVRLLTATSSGSAPAGAASEPPRAEK
ncbi:MAG TPA: hypothetical protein VGZ22_16075, partial [Isosphaeraceae bacterium]|nr:hypothetical protein [Isosphaeraceae bacterium]